jgi:hypothetical protein
VPIAYEGLKLIEGRRRPTPCQCMYLYVPSPMHANAAPSRTTVQRERESIQKVTEG